MRASGTDGVDVSAEQTIFGELDSDGTCITIGVRVHADSAAPVAIQVPQSHVNYWVRIPAGEKEYFRVGSKGPLAGVGANGIHTVKAKGIGGTATIDWWVAVDAI